MRAFLARVAVLALLLASPAQAAVSPTPGPEDARIRSVDFDPEQVVQLKGFVGYQLMLEFGPDERIENVAVGDATAWQVTPNRRANLLFLKPLVPEAATNMTVVTDLRRYAFELTAGSPMTRAADLAYIVRFRFAPAADAGPAARPAPPPVRNRAYTVKGSRLLTPAEVFDDGTFTYFRWGREGVIPAIFVLDAEGHESLPNYGVRQGYVVVEQLAARFLLRNGRDVATVTGGARPIATATAGGRR